MAKVKVEGNTISGNAEDIMDVLKSASKEMKQKAIQITGATIKDGLCNYGYEILAGPGMGDKIPTRKGSNYIHNDMTDAFVKLNVHLAMIDDAFLHQEESDLDSLSESPTTGQFLTTGFKILGTQKNQGFIIIGGKYVTAGFINLETPKITKSSHYKYFDELTEAVLDAAFEVEQYMNGKAQPKLEQSEIPFVENEDDFNSPVE